MVFSNQGKKATLQSFNNTNYYISGKNIDERKRIDNPHPLDNNTSGYHGYQEQDVELYMAFEHGSTCVLTPIRDPFNQDLLGFDVYDKLGDCPEVGSGWTRIEFLVVDGQISPWFTGPDGDFWRIYSTEEYLGQNFETPEVVQYASEMDCKYGNSEANYKATWYFSSIDY